jgi:integrase
MKLEKIAGSQNDGLYREVATGKIYVRKYREGRGEIFRSTKTIAVTNARIIRDRLYAEFWGEKKNNAPRETAAESWKIWATGIENTKSIATIASVRSTYKHLSKYFDRMFLDDISLSWWTNVYIPEKRLETHEDRKFFNDWKWLSMFLKWSQETGRVKSRPKLRNPDPKRESVGRSLENEEIEALLQHAPTTELHLQILMAATMGMRSSEIAQLEWSRVDLNNQAIILRAVDTKIRKARLVPMSMRVFEQLNKRSLKPRVSGFVFPARFNSEKSQTRDSKNTSWKVCRKLAAVQCRFHDLRHSFLTKAFRSQGANPALICAFAGLSLDEAQKTYLHFSVDDLRQVAELVRFDA